MTTSASTTRSIPSQPIICPSIRLVQEAMSDVKDPMMPSALAACLVDALANVKDSDDPMTPSVPVPTPAISHSSPPRLWWEESELRLSLIRMGESQVICKEQQPAMGASSRAIVKAMAMNKNNSSNDEPRETIMLSGCDYNHWLIVIEFPNDLALMREQMMETNLNTLSTVLQRCHFDWVSSQCF